VPDVIDRSDSGEDPFCEVFIKFDENRDYGQFWTVFDSRSDAESEGKWSRQQDSINLAR
jgi:hypothetical protein